MRRLNQSTTVCDKLKHIQEKLNVAHKSRHTDKIEFNYLFAGETT